MIDRLLRRLSGAALALGGAFLLLFTLYAWQAWNRATPTIFTDELELTQISRSIAETGFPGRRGEAYHFSTLVPWFTAPFWWISDVGVAYAAIKYFQAFVMTLALVPAYLLARMVVSRPWAVFAGVATAASPALSYAPMFTEEPFAYPISTGALFLCVRAVAAPTPRSVGLAAAVGLVAMYTRSQLLALPAALVLALLARAWGSSRARAWRATWDGWDRAGAAALGLGALFAATAFLGSRSQDWATVHATFKDRILEYGSWAGGAFAVGVGLVPAVALVAVALLPAAARREPLTNAFALVTTAATLTFGYYAALKGAHLSTVFSSLVVERNLIYLGPLAFVATALLLERALAPLRTLLAASGLVTLLVLALPVHRGLDTFPYYEAHGLAILALPNRLLEWPLSTVEPLIVALSAVAGSLLVWRRLAGPGGGKRLAVALASFILVWNVTNEIYAWTGEHDLAARIDANLPRAKDWVDQIVGDESVTIFAQQVTNATGIHSTEFWNRSVKHVWSVEGSAPGPGPTQTPDLADGDGTLWPSPGTPYVLTFNGVEVQGEVVARVEQLGPQLVRIGDALRLKYNFLGVFEDGWAGGRSSYNRFDVAADGPGLAVIELSRQRFCQPGSKLPDRVTVRFGTIGIGSDRQPRIDRVLKTETLRLPSCGREVVLFQTPLRPWRVEIEAETFKPSDYDERIGDARELGLVLSVVVVPDTYRRAQLADGDADTT
ncbi:MAG: hypothetical protein EXQ77_05090 [Thermoleophilia bacterium]|nr:hypothetical protein [Thermoleophilia bacterium]